MHTTAAAQRFPYARFSEHSLRPLAVDVPPTPPDTVPTPPPPPTPPDIPPEVIDPVLPGENAPVRDPLPQPPSSPAPVMQRMPARTQFEHDLLQHRRLFGALEALREPICSAGDAMAERLRAGGRLVFFGNAGAGAIAHLLAALLNARLRAWRESAAAITLPHDPIAMTGLVRQYGLAEALSMLMAVQMSDALQAGDCVVAISTSGESDNVVRALQRARQSGVMTIGLLGRDGGRAARLVHRAVVVPHSDSARLYEAQLMIGHSWCAQVAGTLLEPMEQTKAAVL